MSKDEFLESIVSDEELRALLRDQSEPEAAPAPESRMPRERFAVVLASRRSGDAAPLSERLSAHGFRVDVVRNAFRALDLLRTRRYVAILSDFRLWADGARLLFERIEGMADPPLVVFLSDRNTPPERRPPRAGVAGELLCPLSPLEIEVAVEQLTAVAEREVTAPAKGIREPGTAGRGSPSAPGPFAPRDFDPPSDVAIGSSAPRDALLTGRSALALGPYRWEVPWLRFFLEAQRRLRSHENRDALFGALVELAREVLGAEAAAISVETNGQLRVQTNVAATPGDSGQRTRLSEISDLLEAPAERRAAGPRVFSLEVPFPPDPHRGESAPTAGEEKTCRVVFAGLSRSIGSVAPTFREDLRHLIREALTRR